MTFEKLDLLLRSVCDGLESSEGVYPSRHKEQESIAVAALNLLKLQVKYSIVLCVILQWNNQNMRTLYTIDLVNFTVILISLVSWAPKTVK